MHSLEAEQITICNQVFTKIEVEIFYVDEMVFKANGIRITDQQFRESKQSKVMVDYIFFIVEYIYQNQTYTY